ncbi:peptidase M23 [Gordonia sp. PKS22-38]|uniref:Peptidase M23 n=1 Tax=Gordonia prachuapensis TaxID=3115651 RepID=A0ABU7MR00_9ACTN|nr:peptidase M23 [Gordonia sp. PKS22-38]
MSSAVAVSAHTAGTSTGSGGADQIVHAELELFEPTKAPGGAKPGGKLGSIPFQFNPREVTITKAARWESKPTKGAAKAGAAEFMGAQPCTLSLEMFLDATAKHDDSVAKGVDRLMSCCVPTSATTGTPKAIPPLVVFKWGGLTSFPGFITKVTAKFTLFAADGAPLRAVCTVEIEEMPGGKGGQNPTSRAASARRSHVLIAGESLATLAHREYGDPQRWRDIASFNGIDDPLRVPSGTRICLPAVDDARAGDRPRELNR